MILKGLISMEKLNLYKRIAHAKGETEKSQMLSDAQASFNDYLNSTLTATDVTIGDSTYKVSVQDVNEQNNKDLRDDKFLICSVDTPVNVGDLVYWIEKDKTYIVTLGEDMTVNSHKRFKMYPCNYTLKWVDKVNNEIKESLCVVEDATMYTDGVREENVISYADQMVRVVLPTIAESPRFKMERRFFIDDGFYKITSINRLTKGVSRLMLVSTLKSENDNEELGIADYYDLKEEEETPVTSVNLNLVGSKYWLWTGESITYTLEATDDLGNTLDGVATFDLSNGNATITNFTDKSVTVRAGMTAFVDFEITATFDGNSTSKKIDIRRL